MGLMSNKTAAPAIESEFPAEGLDAMAGDENLQLSLAKSLADGIDDKDIQRNWANLRSGLKTREGGALAEAGKKTEPSLFDNLQEEVQLVVEATIESHARQTSGVVKEAPATTETDYKFNPSLAVVDDEYFGETEEDEDMTLTPAFIKQMLANMRAMGMI